jgi:hypothetical protein
MRRRPLYVALAIAASTLPTKAEGMKEKFLSNFGAMLAMQAHCPSWKINGEKVADLLEFFKVKTTDISPGRRDWPIIEKSVTEIGELADGLSEENNCLMTNGMFGPKGNVAPGFMVPK